MFAAYSAFNKLLLGARGPALIVHRITFALSLPVHVLTTQFDQSWPYYITRSAGLVAAALLILLILSGIGQFTGFSYRLMEPLAAWTLHRALAIACGVCIIIHGVMLYFDKFVPFSIQQMLIPFKATYDHDTIGSLHVGSLYVAFGIIAGYLTAIVILTSLFWMVKMPRLWRVCHYLGYIIVLLVFFHGLMLGADLKHGLLRAVWLICGILIIVGVIYRLRRVRSLK